MQIDWLSINYTGQLLTSKLFTSKVMDFKTRSFNKVTEFYTGSELFCTAVSEPSSRIIQSDLVQIKIANKWLYSKGLLNSLELFISEHELKFKGFSRVDICHDFTVFDNGLMPNELIKGYLSGDYIKKGTNKITFYGENKKGVEYDYIRFGSGKSNLTMYMYNKSKELRQVKTKPYINELWKKQGIDENKEVYRLEFSITGDTFKLIESETGEVIPHSIQSILDNSIINGLYNALLKKYFVFYEQGTQVRKDRLTKLMLFANIVSDIIYLNYSDKLGGNRSDKIFINKCLKTWDELRKNNNDLCDVYYELSIKHANQRGLHQYQTFKEQEYYK